MCGKGEGGVTVLCSLPMQLWNDVLHPRGSARLHSRWRRMSCPPLDCTALGGGEGWLPIPVPWWPDMVKESVFEMRAQTSCCICINWQICPRPKLTKQVIVCFYWGWKRTLRGLVCRISLVQIHGNSLFQQISMMWMIPGLCFSDFLGGKFQI